MWRPAGRAPVGGRRPGGRRYADPAMSDLRRFDPGAFGAFRVLDRSFDPGTRTAVLDYALYDGPSFTETIVFETPPGGEVDEDMVARALPHLHIAAGTSYYKTAAPPLVRVESARLTAAEAEFHRHLYDDGLREFAVRNGLPVPRPVAVEAPPAPDRRPPRRRDRPGGVVVPI